MEGEAKRAKLTGTKPATVRASDNQVSHWQLERMASPALTSEWQAAARCWYLGA